MANKYGITDIDDSLYDFRYDEDDFFRIREGLTPEIAADSIFTYLEDELGMQVTTSNRTITMEYATAEDRALLDLLDFDMLAVVENRTFNSEGVHFETTWSRHRPDYFTFMTTAVRGC